MLVHLNTAGAAVEHSWVSPDRDIWVVRYAANGHEGTLVVSHVAANVLDHWTAEDIDEFLQGLRVVEAVEDLGAGLAFFIRGADGPTGTFKERGIVMVEVPKENLGLA
ncbi:MAG TPA: hypothetical protein VMD91_07810 [Candidatus Sulfotelmatobacter sp.]|nr:hypothetical protein [Candidatus Sulfotelmatobacter sp.]